jgi:hypothetical protein
MRERPDDAARELSRRLMRLCDENVSYLRGAVAAADAICDLLFAEAEQNGAVLSTHRGLRWALEEAEAAVAALGEDLHAAHRLALEQAGGVLPPTS